jgi:signal transduction histidine kinase
LAEKDKKKKEKEKENKSIFEDDIKEPSFKHNLWNTNTIMITIVTTFSLVMFIIVLIMFAFAKSIIGNLQEELTSDYLSNLQVVKRALHSNQYEDLQPELNSILSGSYIVKFLIVTNDKWQEVYSTVDKNTMSYEIVSPEQNHNIRKAYIKINSDNFGLQKKVKIIPVKYGYNTIFFGISTSNLIKSNLDQLYKNSCIFFAILLFVIMWLSIWLAGSISKPLSIMEKKISKIAEGDLSERLEYTKFRELNRLVLSYNVMADTLQRLYSSLEAQVQSRTQELKSAYAELQNTQAIMVHSEKMKSLGELVAGIMHEINNPINFIYGNMTHLSNYSKDLMEIIIAYEKYDSELKPEEKTEVDNIKKEIDYDFLKTDMPDLIKSCKEGAERAKNIIQDLKSFSRMEEAAITDVDIPHEIDMTLNILHNKIKHKAEVHKEYIDYVPKIEAFGGQLNQVFMNVIDNAVGAIKDHGDIWIRIKLDDFKKHLILEIEDNGVGMDEETCRKTFDPFFTTKPVGQGTGLGMSIAHKIIKSHQGEISVTSKLGVGTKFTIKLPLKLDREILNNGLKNEGE